MAADSIELIWRRREHAEPRAVLPAGRTGDHRSALHSLKRLFRGCDSLLRSSERRCADRDRHSDRGYLSHSCHSPRVSLFCAKGKSKCSLGFSPGGGSVRAEAGPTVLALHRCECHPRPRAFDRPRQRIPIWNLSPATGPH